MLTASQELRLRNNRWTDDKYEYVSLPVGMLPEKGKWVRDGIASGAGGAVTHRQVWKRKIPWYKKLFGGG